MIPVSKLAAQDHGIALVSLWLPGHRVDEISIWAQCECGWFAKFETPITLARLAEICRVPHGPKP